VAVVVATGIGLPVIIDDAVGESIPVAGIAPGTIVSPDIGNILLKGRVVATPEPPASPAKKVAVPLLGAGDRGDVGRIDSDIPMSEGLRFFFFAG
jgi:hypothetical protein